MPRSNPPTQPTANQRERSWFTNLGISATIVGALVALGNLALGHREQPSAPPIYHGPSARPPVSATESNAWHVALANRKDCDAIRKYILRYPDGHFVASAQALLAARRPVNEAKWVAFEFPSNVVASSSLEARASRDTACESANVQLLRNMADGCSDFSRDPSKYRSVIVKPPSNTNCQCEDSAIHIGTTGADAVWRCTIRATYRCRGEQIERVTAYSCD